MAITRKMDISRRSFLSGTAAAVAAFNIVPGRVLAAAGRTSANEKLNVAAIGIGGRGAADLNEIAADKGVNIVGLCDVDAKQGGGSFGKFSKAKKYTDFRKMFDEMEKSIDAVLVATPDHFHAVAVSAAIKRGKHVYCEKPLAHSIWEVRELMKLAGEHKVVTQLGNQGHSFDSIRMFREWVEDGAIGKVHTVHAGCRSVYSRIKDLPQLSVPEPVPPTLDWDQWLGPVPARPYHSFYVPSKWRGWTAFGTGVLGDWTCHVVDPVFWTLDLGAPVSIMAKAEGYDPKAHGETFPRGTEITYQFAPKGDRGSVKLVWHDGESKIPHPEELGPDRKVPDIGAVVLGDKGGISYGSHGAAQVRIFPEEKMRAYQAKMKADGNRTSIPRIPGGHYQDWLGAIRSGQKAGSDFSYGGPLTEIALLGVIAIRLLGTELKWDEPGMRFTNSEEANQFIKPVFRQGWAL